MMLIGQGRTARYQGYPRAVTNGKDTGCLPVSE